MTLMVPNTGGFSMGTSSTPSGDGAMGKTLDEMIRDRRKDQVKSTRKGPKGPSTADRTIATGKAKRQAAANARRGLSDDKKPSAMDVEREVYRQSRKTDNAKKRNEQKKTGGRVPPDSSLREKKKRNNNKKNDPPAAVFGGRTPPKKAVEAAVKGMEDAGFKVPAGHQVVMTFVPVVIAPPANNDGKGKKGGGNDNRGPGGRGPGNRGPGGRGSGGRGPGGRGKK